MSDVVFDAKVEVILDRVFTCCNTIIMIDKQLRKRNLSPEKRNGLEEKRIDIFTARRVAMNDHARLVIEYILKI